VKLAVSMIRKTKITNALTRLFSLIRRLRNPIRLGERRGHHQFFMFCAGLAADTMAWILRMGRRVTSVPSLVVEYIRVAVRSVNFH
jgi:hypothetical protein